ncbi:MAG: hypothetical protein LUD03_06070 [Firmicutes bacterium]|nr:hypothetical protein [Bacillota bacterium]
MEFYNDTFMEYLIKKKKETKDWAFVVLLAVAGVVFTALMIAVMFYMVIAGQGSIGTPLGLVIIAFAWYGVYLLVSMRNVEYEYILTNSAMDIDKVMSKKGRKHLVSWDFKEIEICANVDDAEHKYEYNNPPSKVYDLTGDKSRGGVYFVDYESEDEGRVRVLFQPTSKIIETARKYNMRKIFVM